MTETLWNASEIQPGRIPLGMKKLEQLYGKVQDALAFMQANVLDYAMTWDSIRESARFLQADGGDFVYEDPGENDWIPEYDDDDGVWRKYCYGSDIRRQNGVLSLMFQRCNSDGDWECMSEEDDLGGTYLSPAAAMDALNLHCVHALLRMALYDIYCAATGTDPLDNILPDYTKAGKRKPKTAAHIRRVSAKHLEKRVEELLTDVQTWRRPTTPTCND